MDYGGRRGKKKKKEKSGNKKMVWEIYWYEKIIKLNDSCTC